MLTIVSPYPGEIDPFAVQGPISVREAVIGSLTNLWNQLIQFVPSLVAALVIIIIGWTVAVAAGRFVEKILLMLGINQMFDRFKGLQAAMARANVRFNLPLVTGEVVKWLLLTVTLLIASDVLGLQEVSSFLMQILLYIPNVIVAAVILIIAVLLANFVYHTVAASVRAAGFSSADAIATISKWAVLVFAFFAALLQLQVAVALIQTLLTAFFAMCALAGGLAFGLGGKDLAAKWLKKLEQDITGKS